MICKTCNKKYNKSDRHLKCSKCRSLKLIKKERTCKVCNIQFIGIKNICSPCKFQKDKSVIKERPCVLCNKLHKRPGTVCNKCNRIKYKKSYRNYDKLHSAEKRLNHKKASLGGIFNKEIQEIYNKCPENHDVDHIIPLKNKNVCGLHVPWNLQHLEKNFNNYKRNKFDFTYSNETWKKGR